MTEKFDLKRMLEEIKQDEQTTESSRGKLSQDEIREIIARKKLARKGTRSD